MRPALVKAFPGARVDVGQLNLNSRLSMISIKRVGRLIATGLAFVASIGVAANAQQAQSTITGRVTDANGNGVPGANVVIPSLGIGVGANTKVDGTYTLVVPAGSVGRNVVITARRIGFAPVS